MESRLLVVFNNVNEWLRFAEAKNAMIIGLNGVVFFGVTRLINFDQIKDIELLIWYLFIGLLCLGASMFVALLSFVPQLKQIAPTFDLKKENDNFLFFASLKNKKVDEVISIYNTDKEKVEPFHKHLSQQIICNAGITKRKYDHFTFACWLTIAAFITPIIALIYAGYNYIKK